MATTKKTTKKTTPRAATKPASTKKAPVKKTVAKKQPAKKTATKKQDMRSFRVAEDPHSFTTLKVTRQTVYWVILVSFIIFAQLWILRLQIDVASLVEIQQTQVESQLQKF